MRPGNLRDRVTICRAAHAPDEYGNTVESWSELVTVSADVLESPGREAIAAGRIEAQRSATIRMRRSPATLAVTEADRLVCRGRQWNIRSIGAVGRDNMMLEFVCEVGVAP